RGPPYAAFARTPAAQGRFESRIPNPESRIPNPEPPFPISPSAPELLLRLYQPGFDLGAAAGVGAFSAGARRGGERFLEGLHRARVVLLVEQEIAPEVVGVDALGCDRQALLQQFAGRVLVAEAERPAGHLVVEAAEAGVGRAVEDPAIL